MNSPYDLWFQLDEVREWRERLRKEYKRGTLRYLQVKASSGGSLEQADRVRRAVRVGREGLELRSGDEILSHRTRRHLERLVANRDRVSKALDGLLALRPIHRISLTELQRRAGLHNASMYAAFRSGVSGAYCYWATNQLDILSASTREQLTRDVASKREVTDVLKRWSELVARFVLERPHGRLAIISFIVYEIDSIGASLIAETKGQDDTELRRRLQIVDEFTALAASLHRAGARLIHNLQKVFRDSKEFTETGRLARELWSDIDNASWNAAVSFWQTNLTNLLSIGILEAEREVVLLREFAFRAWCQGASQATRSSQRRSITKI